MRKKLPYLHALIKVLSEVKILNYVQLHLITECILLRNK